jgi:UDP-2-acetamido-3-amino-2,3-dideoxy-glucuronate N-acetyltransferase
VGNKCEGLFVHNSADVSSEDIGQGTRIWQFCVILAGAKIGAECNICAHVLIEGDVVVGDRATVKSGVQLWNGLRVGNDVFIGPNATFTNDLFPRSKQYPEKYLQTTIEDGASIGAGAVILPGLVIGRGAMVGAGATVTRSVPPRAVVVGNPARVVGYTDTEKQIAPPLGLSPQSVQPIFDGTRDSIVCGVTLHRFPFISDMRGNLSVGEFERSVPFTPKRYFLVFNVPSVETRGEHAHRQCKQFLVCVKGSCSVVADDGQSREEFLLDKPNLGLYLPPMTWGIQYRYSADAVLLVFASEYYEKDDYIRDYAEFMKLAGERP